MPWDSNLDHPSRRHARCRRYTRCRRHTRCRSLERYRRHARFRLKKSVSCRISSSSNKKPGQFIAQFNNHEIIKWPNFLLNLEAIRHGRLHGEHRHLEAINCSFLPVCLFSSHHWFFCWPLLSNINYFYYLLSLLSITTIIYYRTAFLIYSIGSFALTTY